MASRIALCLSTILLLAGCGGDSPTPVMACEAVGEMVPDCRFMNPEDLALLPDGDTLIVSQFGSMDGSRPGSILAYSLSQRSIRTLYPKPDAEDSPRWGDPSCPPPDPARFAPHGIDLQARDDGTLSLLVVNHGGRESVEFLEVVDGDLDWRGCAQPPAPAWLNDVVGAPDGSFWVTHMMPSDSQTLATVKGLLGQDTGFVYEWRPDAGFSRVAGSDGPMPNGIERSPDGQFLYINQYLAGEVRKLDLGTGRVVATATAPGPDNVTWSRDGKLLVASHTAGVTELAACGDLFEGACGFEYEIVRIDPADMSRQTLVRHSGAPLGGVTVAVDTGSEFVFGTFAGDRIVRMPKP